MRKISDILFDFMKMSESLQKRNDIVILNNHLFPPASAGDFNTASDVIGKQLDKDIVDFYKETNGFQLRWISKSYPRFNPSIHVENELPFTYLEVITEEFYFDGCVNILPINEVFFDIDWNTVFIFEEDAGKTFNFQHENFNLLHLKQKLRPFDLFSRNECMSFFNGSSNDFLPCVLQQSYYLDFNTSRITDFNSYLEFVLANRAASKFRRSFYNKINGHLDELLITHEDFWNDENIFIF